MLGQRILAGTPFHPHGHEKDINNTFTYTFVCLSVCLLVVFNCYFTYTFDCLFVCNVHLCICLFSIVLSLLHFSVCLFATCICVCVCFQLFFHFSVCLLVCLSVCNIHLSMSLFYICLFVRLSVGMFSTFICVCVCFQFLYFTVCKCVCFSLFKKFLVESVLVFSDLPVSQILICGFYVLYLGVRCFITMEADVLIYIHPVKAYN
jgi:hypothetical protein